MTMLYLCIRIPEFAAQARLRIRPELSLAPLAILRGDPPFEEVCSLNMAARHLGVAEGMTRAELDSFVGLQTLRRSEEEERTSRAALLETASSFTPRTQVWNESDSVFVMVLDMTGTTALFGLPSEAANRVAVAMKQLGFFTQIAGSANFHAAVCATYPIRSKPFIIPPGQESECLANLPLSALTPSQPYSDTMALWGISTLGELAALPEVDLVVRLGQEGKRLRLLACGQHPYLMVPEEAQLVLEEFIALDAPVDLLDSLLLILGPMLDQILLRAGNRSLALASVTAHLGLDGGGIHTRTVQPALPVVQRDLLLKLLHLDLQAHPPSAGILSVHVCAEPGDRSKVQLGLFAPQLPEASRLDVALARIAALVGVGRVGKARLLDTHKPDAFVMERFTVTESNVDIKPAKASIAIRRCRPARPIRVQQSQDAIDFFALDGKRYAVQEQYGPWRRSGDWWTAQVWSYEEWDVLASANEKDTLLCRITHNLLTHRWQLEALYD